MNIARMVRNFLAKKNSIDRVSNVIGSNDHVYFECHDGHGNIVIVSTKVLTPSQELNNLRIRSLMKELSGHSDTKVTELVSLVDEIVPAIRS